MKKSRAIELLIFFIFMGILIFLGVRIFKHTFDIGKTYRIEFNDIDSISIGSPVRILGVDIGHVTKIRSIYNKIEVDFVVNNDKVDIPDGTHATIAFFGIAGSRSIELTPPDKSYPEGTGIVVVEPIRIGDALGIVGEFTRDTMMSIGGLYEFAKDKTKDEVDVLTRNFHTKVTTADDKIMATTNKITTNGENFRTGINNTTNGMNKIYDTTKMFNFPEFVTYSRYGLVFLKRTFAQAKNNIIDFNDEAENCSKKINGTCEKVKFVADKFKNIDKLENAFLEVDAALNRLDKSLSQENIDKVYDTFEKIKIFSENLNNSIK